MKAQCSPGSSFARTGFRSHRPTVPRSRWKSPSPSGTPGEQSQRCPDITKEPFEDLRGNVAGYAYKHSIAVSPLSPLPCRTRLHEIAHVVLGHTADAEMRDQQTPDRAGCEGEADGAAYLCLASLYLPGLDESRGYLQGWLRDTEIDQRSIARIFSAADRILKAGRPAAEAPGA
jgi:hypothetical protein